MYRKGLVSVTDRSRERRRANASAMRERSADIASHDGHPRQVLARTATPHARRRLLAPRRAEVTQCDVSGADAQ